jgi:serine/threonine protein kinase
MSIPQKRPVMQLQCPHCHAVLEFAERRPAFCAYCGHALSTPVKAAEPPPRPGSSPTVDFDAEGATLAPPPVGDADFALAPAPEVVGGYRLLRPIGIGGMGTVYEAEEMASGRHVALKLISASSGSREAAERFRREGRLASAIQHPRCVFVLAADEDAGRPYIVMELMSGQTLHDLVKEKGPLPPAEAVAKILDVIDGLYEAHQLGVVHRDMKPSNCFLEDNGRVKIGDFGLAKTLSSDTHLTKTGSFMGTALFASPEQVRADPVDQRSDVYAVAATLYFLLTGRAPHQTGDAAATLARIVSDPAPSMRALRQEIPAALDQVVLRGLERSRDRRWPDLAAMRQALLPFVAEQVRLAPVGVRLGAYLLDCCILLPVWMTLSLVPLPEGTPAPLRALHSNGLVPWVLYLLLLEGRWGCTLGKRWLRLRVYAAHASGPAAFRAIALRTLFFSGLVSLPWCGLTDSDEPNLRDFGILAANLLLGAALVAAPMRRHNGYRGLHEFLSRTRVVRLPPPERARPLPSHRVEELMVRPAELPERVGPFAVRGALCWSEEVKLVAADDPALGRRVWLELRPPAAAGRPAVRRDLSRPARLRWLASGHTAAWQWDAFLAPSGCPLAEVVRVGGRLAWPEARPLLEQLTEELLAARREATLPDVLAVQQVWVQPNGRVRLLDVPPVTPPAAGPVADPCLALLRDVALLALEGRPRPPGARPAPVRAPVPEHARRMLDRLLGVGGQGYGDVGQLQADLAATHDQPVEVTRGQRALAVMVLAAVLFIPLVWLFTIPRGLVAASKAEYLKRFAGCVRLAEQRCQRLEDGARGEYLLTASYPLPLVQLSGAMRWAGDSALSQAVRQRLEGRYAQEKRLRQSAGFLWLQDPPVAVEKQPVDDQAADFRKAAWWAVERQDFLYYAGLDPTEFWFITALFIAAGPILWVGWAFLLRGGLSPYLLGLSLRRSDGREASRLQCAWRAVLVWAPVCALLSLALWLDNRCTTRWSVEEPFGWLSWLSWLCWGLAVALLPLYVALALRSPNRAPHDRLAGTYLVPR